MYNNQYYVYILTNRTDSVLYIGMTNNLERRLFEHTNKLVDGFSKKYNLCKLVYFEMTEDVKVAILREKQLKNWHREWKNNLINEFNPEWNDLRLNFNFSNHNQTLNQVQGDKTSLLY